ncbi:unnamed protein product [Cutaneotrichosporon oleaginosum]
MLCLSCPPSSILRPSAPPPLCPQALRPSPLAAAGDVLRHAPRQMFAALVAIAAQLFTVHVSDTRNRCSTIKNNLATDVGGLAVGSLSSAATGNLSGQAGGFAPAVAPISSISTSSSISSSGSSSRGGHKPPRPGGGS